MRAPREGQPPKSVHLPRITVSAAAAHGKPWPQTLALHPNPTPWPSTCKHAPAQDGDHAPLQRTHGPRGERAFRCVEPDDGVRPGEVRVVVPAPGVSGGG